MPLLPQADACNLDPRYKGFDVVLAANLLEHIAYPRRFLQEIPSRINAGGLLVIASTFAWDAAVCLASEHSLVLMVTHLRFFSFA